MRSAAATWGVAGVAMLALLLGGCGSGHGPAAPGASAAGKSPAPAASATSSGTAAATSAATAAGAGSQLAGMSVADLLAAARSAYAEHRLVAPAGNNAMQYYEAVLAKDPHNQVATDALREIFPFGVPDVEKAISANDFPEASREIGVLAKADPTNYTLTLLRAKLDAQQKLQARQQLQQQQTVQRAARLASARKAAAKAEAERAEAAKVAKTAPAASVQHVAPAPRPVAAPPAPKPAGVTRGAEVVRAVPASYPLDAARSQISGFAVVQFTVTAAGRVIDARVVDGAPRGVFNQAAISAVEHSTYKPALRDGSPVSAVLRRRVDFKLGG
ncbi:MAG TPA: energy transducer TonB [Rhodanobacteraceae bacterium]